MRDWTYHKYYFKIKINIIFRKQNLSIQNKIKKSAKVKYKTIFFIKKNLYLKNLAKLVV